MTSEDFLAPLLTLSAAGVFAGIWKAVQWYLQRNDSRENEMREWKFKERAEVVNVLTRQVEHLRKELHDAQERANDSQSITLASMLSAANSRSLTEEAPFPAWSNDINGLRFWQNQAYSELFGWTEAETMHKRYSEFMPHDLAVRFSGQEALVRTNRRPFETVEQFEDFYGVSHRCLIYRWPQLTAGTVTAVHGIAVPLDEAMNLALAHAAIKEWLVRKMEATQ